MNKKNFKSLSTNIYNDNLKITCELEVPASNTIVNFLIRPGCGRKFDFAPYYGNNYDEVVYACQKIIECLLSESTKNGEKTITECSLFYVSVRVNAGCS